MYLKGDSALVLADRRRVALHRPRQVDAERLRRELQQTLPGRVSPPRAVLAARQGPQRYHLVTGGLQPPPTTCDPQQHHARRVRPQILAGKAGRLRREMRPRTLPQIGEQTGLRSIPPNDGSSRRSALARQAVFLSLSSNPLASNAV